MKNNNLEMRGKGRGRRSPVTDYKVVMVWEDGVKNIVHSSDLRECSDHRRRARPVIGKSVHMYYLDKWFLGTILYFSKKEEKINKFVQTHNILGRKRKDLISAFKHKRVKSKNTNKLETNTKKEEENSSDTSDSEPLLNQIKNASSKAIHEEIDGSELPTNSLNMVECNSQLPIASETSECNEELLSDVEIISVKEEVLSSIEELSDGGSDCKIVLSEPFTLSEPFSVSPNYSNELNSQCLPIKLPDELNSTSNKNVSEIYKLKPCSVLIKDTVNSYSCNKRISNLKILDETKSTPPSTSSVSPAMKRSINKSSSNLDKVYETKSTPPYTSSVSPAMKQSSNEKTKFLNSQKPSITATKTITTKINKKDIKKRIPNKTHMPSTKSAKNVEQEGCNLNVKMDKFVETSNTNVSNDITEKKDWHHRSNFGIKLTREDFIEHQFHQLISKPRKPLTKTTDLEPKDSCVDTTNDDEEDKLKDICVDSDDRNKEKSWKQPITEQDRTSEDEYSFSEITSGKKNSSQVNENVVNMVIENEVNGTTELLDKMTNYLPLNECSEMLVSKKYKRVEDHSYCREQQGNRKNKDYVTETDTYQSNINENPESVVNKLKNTEVNHDNLEMLPNHIKCNPYLKNNLELPEKSAPSVATHNHLNYFDQSSSNQNTSPVSLHTPNSHNVIMSMVPNIVMSNNEISLVNNSTPLTRVSSSTNIQQSPSFYYIKASKCVDTTLNGNTGSSMYPCTILPKNVKSQHIFKCQYPPDPTSSEKIQKILISGNCTQIKSTPTQIPNLQRLPQQSPSISLPNNSRQTQEIFVSGNSTQVMNTTNQIPNLQRLPQQSSSIGPPNNSRQTQEMLVSGNGTQIMNATNQIPNLQSLPRQSPSICLPNNNRQNISCQPISKCQCPPETISTEMTHNERVSANHAQIMNSTTQIPNLQSLPQQSHAIFLSNDNRQNMISSSIMGLVAGNPACNVTQSVNQIQSSNYLGVIPNSTFPQNVMFTPTQSVFNRSNCVNNSGTNIKQNKSNGIPQLFINQTSANQFYSSIIPTNVVLPQTGINRPMLIQSSPTQNQMLLVFNPSSNLFSIQCHTQSDFSVCNPQPTHNKVSVTNNNDITNNKSMTNVEQEIVKCSNITNTNLSQINLPSNVNKNTDNITLVDLTSNKDTSSNTTEKTSSANVTVNKIGASDLGYNSNQITTDSSNKSKSEIVSKNSNITPEEINLRTTITTPDLRGNKQNVCFVSNKRSFNSNNYMRSNSYTEESTTKHNYLKVSKGIKTYSRAFTKSVRQKTLPVRNEPICINLSDDETPERHEQVDANLDTERKPVHSIVGQSLKQCSTSEDERQMKLNLPIVPVCVNLSDKETTKQANNSALALNEVHTTETSNEDQVPKQKNMCKNGKNDETNNQLARLGPEVSDETSLEDCLDGVPPFIREVFTCDNIRDGFINTDLVFVLSLLPDIEEMTDSQKINFQLKVVDIIDEVFNDPELKTVETHITK